MYANSELKYTKEKFEPLIHKMIDYSQQARRDGILSLEKSREDEKNLFLNMALMHTIDGFDKKVIKRILNLEIKYTIKYFKQNPQKLIPNEISKDEFKIALDRVKREMKIIRDGVLAISDGDNPRIVEELLCKYIVKYIVMKSYHNKFK